MNDNKNTVKKVDWVSPRIIIGAVAKGDYYYERKELQDELWKELIKGNHIINAAPRRVGKSSLMWEIQQNPVNGYLVLFKNVESAKSKEEYYQIIYNLIISCLTGLNGTSEKIRIFLKSLRIKDIKTTGISIESIEIDYKSEINLLVPQLSQINEQIVLLIDELPEVLHKLHVNGQSEQAQDILNTIRVWRQDDNFKKLQFVYAGSVGFNQVVELISGRTNDINDLHVFRYRQMGSTEALNYIKWATQNATISYSEKIAKILLSKIQYFVPYFINLMLDEIDNHCRKSNLVRVDTKIIDLCFGSIIKINDYFIDYTTRLKKYNSNEDFLFMNEVLTHIAHRDGISIQEIYNKAVNHKNTTEYMLLISRLETDGYLVEENGKHIFISPFLKEFWKRINPIYNA